MHTGMEYIHTVSTDVTWQWLDLTRLDATPHDTWPGTAQSYPCRLTVACHTAPYRTVPNHATPYVRHARAYALPPRDQCTGAPSLCTGEYVGEGVDMFIPIEHRYVTQRCLWENHEQTTRMCSPLICIYIYIYIVCIYKYRERERDTDILGMYVFVPIEHRSCNITPCPILFHTPVGLVGPRAR